MLVLLILLFQDIEISTAAQGATVGRLYDNSYYHKMVSASQMKVATESISLKMCLFECLVEKECWAVNFRCATKADFEPCILLIGDFHGHLTPDDVFCHSHLQV